MPVIIHQPRAAAIVRRALGSGAFVLGALALGALTLGAGPGCGRPPPGAAGPPESQRAAPIAPAPADAGPPADAPPLDRDYPRLAERAVALYQELAAALHGAEADCAAAGDQLRALRATYADVVGANAKIVREGRAGELKPALARHSAPLEAAARAIMQSPAMARCSREPAFTQAFDELVGAPP